jgi:hypothetical protein
MTEKSKQILKKPEKGQTFVWEPIETLNLGPGFLKWTHLGLKKLKSKRETKSSK